MVHYLGIKFDFQNLIESGKGQLDDTISIENNFFITKKMKNHHFLKMNHKEKGESIRR